MRPLSRFCSLAACCMLAVAPHLIHSQMAAPAAPAVGTHASPAKTYDKLLSGMEKEFVDAAEAMPAEKYNFVPPTTMGEFKGVRSFAAQVKHVAETNYYFFGGPDFTEEESKAKGDAIEKLTAKADIVQALKDSFGKAHQTIGEMTDENAFVITKNGTRAGMAAFGISHLMDHYGQICVYLRMNGIVPPASRGSM